MRISERRKTWFALAAIALGATGCSQPPPLSGGKPLDHWVKATQDPDTGIRKEAVCKLGNAGAPNPEAWTAVAAALRDRQPEIRREAILALMKCGPRAQETVPVLRELAQRDPDAQVRVYAAKAAKKLENDAHGGL